MKQKISLKKGDTVEIISGKYKGQKGEIIKLIISKNTLIVNNINLKTKHIKPNKKEEQGQIKSIEAPIHRSNAKICII
uniref:Large ribosomal subunit protein uL24c n=1 Tax=Erythroglossum lusitanicum TaxID=2575615 RepID=A0A4D6WV93_9FLOR|nr:ribosomal protein L24 [Erythroglossum lusitanicum]